MTTAQQLGSPGLPAANRPDAPFDLAFWKAVAESDDPTAFEAYIRTFPDGIFIELARMKIASLEFQAQQRNQIYRPPTERQSYTNSIFDGHWYSPEWNYSYRLQDGVGTATSSNSPNFNPGDTIIGIQAEGPASFSGAQVYRDGKWYSIRGVLHEDGRIYIRGEKNVHWYMMRID